jgi:CubicO group peptidase (beta-lactamase class C family)
MHRVRRLAYCCSAILLLFTTFPTVAEAQDRNRIRAVTDTLLQQLYVRGWFNGAVVLGGEEELYARGFGFANVGAGIPFTPDTPADGASIAKTLTAAAVFMLVQEGKLDLNASVQRYIPEYPHRETAVHHLLSHSAGLPEAEYDFFKELIPPDEVQTTTLHIALLRQRDVQPEMKPGSRFQYSSLGFDVAALALERISGEPWERLLRRRVLEPLGMRATFLRPARFRDWPGVRTLSYRRSGDSLVVDDVFDNEGFYGGSNLYFSARDLYRWSRSFYTRPVLAGESLVRGTNAPMLWDSIASRGGRSHINLLGWYYSTGRRYHYPGALQGFWSSAYRDEERKYSVVYVSNTSMPQWLRPLLTRWLIDIVEGRSPPAVMDPPAYLPIDTRAFDRIAGTYDVDGVGSVRLERHGERMTLSLSGGIVYRAFPVADGQFYVPGLDVWFGFPVDAKPLYGRIKWLSIFHVAEGARAL